MEKRIQINGVWYIEDPDQNDVIDSPESTEFRTQDVIQTVSCLWESRNWCFEASKMLSIPSDFNSLSSADYFSGIDIEIIDKREGRKEDWITDHADNEAWIIGVYDENPESMSDAREMFDAQGLREFKNFVGYLIDNHWIKRKTNE